jgi:hypothetical protein
LPAEPIAEIAPSPASVAHVEESSPEAAFVSEISVDPEHVASADEIHEEDLSGSKRAWWVAAAGIVLAVTTAAALGIPHLGSVSDGARPAPVAKPKATAPAATPVASKVPDSSSAPAPVALAVPTPSAPLTVTLKANRECWLRLVVDGRTETKTLAEGEELSRGANREIELRVGDAGALAVTVNGRPLAPLGRTGQVIDTVFHADLAGSR